MTVQVFMMSFREDRRDSAAEMLAVAKGEPAPRKAGTRVAGCIILAALRKEMPDSRYPSVARIRRATLRARRHEGLALGLIALCILGCSRRPSTETTAGPAATSRAAASRPAPLSLAPLPHGRHAHRAEVLPDGRVITFGGFEHGDASADRGMRATWIFDPARGAWSRGPDLNAPMAAHGSAVVDGIVYAVGGDVERFDAAASKWVVAIGGERFARSHLTAAQFGRRIFVAGGFPAERPRVAIIDPGTGAVEAIPPHPGMAAEDHFAFIAVFGDAIHVMGGLSGDDFQPTRRHHAWTGRTWIEKAPLPVGDCAKFAAWGVDHERARVLVFGGGNFAYDAKSDSWSPLPAPPWPGHRVMPAAFVREGYFYALGGMGEDRARFEVDVFDIEAGRWITAGK
jgi:hypothetical protein